MSSGGWNKSQQDAPRDVSMQLAMIAKYPIRDYEARGISQATNERFGVRCEIDETTGEPSAYYYAYTDPREGTVTGYKRRGLPKQFSVVGKLKGLFGQAVCKQNAQFLCLFEGELDVLSAYEMLKSLGKNYNVASIPNGASEMLEDGSLPAVDATVRREFEWITSHKKIAICFDMDSPGQATARALADYLVGNCEVRLVKLPCKDANAMLQKGMAEEFLKCLFNAELFQPDQIIFGDTDDMDELLTPLPPGIQFECIPKTSRKMHGFRLSEMTTLIAPPKCGKTSLLRQMKYELLSETDESVGGFFLEETAKKTRQSVIAFHCGVALNSFRANPKIADRHKIEEARELLLPRLHLFSHKNKTISDDLLERKIEYMVKSLGCKTVIVDHSTFVIGTRSATNERQEIDAMLTRLARSVEDEKYRLIIVAHIKRGAREQSRTDARQKYPYWDILDMAAGRGSGAYEQLSHNMVGIEKQVLDPESESTRGLVRTRILLNREWGVEGVGDYLTFDSVGKFSPVEVEY